MANYDSDSSGAEDEDYTSTNVLLGYASKEPTDDTISQLGGHPTWMDSKTCPPGNLATCKVCNGLLSLYLQLNGDMPDRFPGHERRLYLLGCRRKTCRRKEGSVRGFRAVRASRIPGSSTKAQEPAKTPAPPQPEQGQPDIGSSLFGIKPSTTTSSTTNPFSMGSSPSSSSNPFASASSLAAKPPQPPAPAQMNPSTNLAETFASKARISSPPPSDSAPPPSPPWPTESGFPSPYPAYYLDADYETLETPSTDIPSQARVTDMDIDGEEGSSSNATADMKDAFESSMDKTFQKFADRLAQNPEQVLRYEFGGQPLLYSKVDTVGRLLEHQVSGQGKVHTASGSKGGRAPRCTSCGAERVFELQLTPHAITELEREEMGLEGMEWGTAILEVCARDCVPKGVKEGEVAYVEEWCGVQWEELVRK